MSISTWVSTNVAKTSPAVLSVRGVNGTFNSFIVPEIDGLTAEVVNNDNSVVLEVVLALPGDFDVDDDVDGHDFLKWQRNPAVGELAAWQSNYGTGVPLAASVNLPEPSALPLAILVVLKMLPGRRGAAHRADLHASTRPGPLPIGISN